MFSVTTSIFGLKVIGRAELHHLSSGKRKDNLVFPLPPVLFPPLVPVQLSLGLALGWMLRGRTALRDAISRQDARR